ncbi:anaerobic ribonucleoside-triphosphate reductase activating protein [Halobacteriovorax sp. HLS]|uniref:anaerobic ribonucleoside-triphosphate reductase activating protein n=1 Tax=Halobacteriovorax sp. HLS TaxID=2234000 RepID=UPI000FD73570|nr:anaerobic ribonucleoside-triphosphate reductase activating protein [Halobacteriovorax sp. HLS]
MNFLAVDITFQEVPNQVSLVISFTGCPVRCKGCHTKEMWNARNGVEFTNATFLNLMKKYRGLISCVCFFGGEWDEARLLELLIIAKNHNLLRCLYTGDEAVSKEILSELEYLKTGPWIQELGGLESPLTNQKFINTRTGELMNEHFQKHTHLHMRGSHVETHGRTN